MARRILVRRRYVVLLLLALLSVVYWTAVWAWVQAATAGVQGNGPEAFHATLLANALTFRATWAWVIGLAGVHALIAAVAARRRDTEALAGAGWSAVCHGLLLVTSGVIRP